MKRLPTERQPQSLAKPAPRRVPVETAWDRFVAIVTDPELQTVAFFCAIGLLIALNLILRFPDFGAVIMQYNQF